MNKKNTKLQFRWKNAQEGESRCWEKNTKKILTKGYQKNKKLYWKKVLEKIMKDENLKNKRIIDVGCGPSGVAIHLNKGYKITCLDSLMDQYLNLFPYLKKIDAFYVNSQVEDYKNKRKFDVIFGFNSIDHVENIKKTLLALRGMLTKNGTMIVTLNCHNYSFIQRILIKYNSVLDKLHPHQFTMSQYKNKIEKAGFKVVKIINLDNETEWVNDKTKKDTEKQKTIRNQLNPGRIFFQLLEKIFSIKRYGKENEKTVYSHFAFVCKKL